MKKMRHFVAVQHWKGGGSLETVTDLSPLIVTIYLCGNEASGAK